MMLHPYSLWPTLLLSFALFLGLTGCLVATRYIANPTAPPPDFRLGAATKELEMRLHHVILPDGPGSWVQGAKWTEWVVSIRNLSERDLFVERISLIDPRGVYVGSQYATVQQLEQETASLTQVYAAYGLGVGSMLLTPALTDLLAPLFTTTATAIPGLFIMGLPSLIAASNQNLEAQDRKAIEMEFSKRRLPPFLRLSSGGSLTGSAFFPFVPQPQALVVNYQTRRGEGQVEIPLDKIPVQPSATSTDQKP